jgi:hypothetical protein
MHAALVGGHTPPTATRLSSPSAPRHSTHTLQLKVCVLLRNKEVLWNACQHGQTHLCLYKLDSSTALLTICTTANSSLIGAMMSVPSSCRRRYRLCNLHEASRGARATPAWVCKPCNNLKTPPSAAQQPKAIHHRVPHLHHGGSQRAINLRVCMYCHDKSSHPLSPFPALFHTKGFPCHRYDMRSTRDKLHDERYCGSNVHDPRSPTPYVDKLMHLE